jgi:transposase
MPRQLSWVFAGNGPSELPRSIYGFGNWAGGIKKLWPPPNKTGRTWPKKRARWREQLAAEPVTRLVFVDESGTHTQMAQWRGRALGGRRLVAHIPQGSYQTSTLISGIRLDSPCVPRLFEGPMNCEMFLAWVRQGLARALQTADLVIMDNLATHKIRGVRETIQARGARLLYLPPYSPDFNPIEPMWSRTKQILRSKAPRTDTELLLAAKTVFQSISSIDCEGFFFSAKYATSRMALL